MDIDAHTASGTLEVDKLFISDLHIGSKFCRATHLVGVLQNIEAKEIYLVGDIIDGERLKRHGRKEWEQNIPEEQRQILDILYAKKAQGAKLHYIAGNHDEVLRESDYSGSPLLGQDAFGMTFSDGENIELGNGRRYRVVHGDYMVDDGLFNVKATRFLPTIGDYLHEKMQELDLYVHQKSPSWLKDRFSLAATMKSLTKTVIMAISGFNRHALKEAYKHSADGIIYGHTHMPGDTTLEHDGQSIHLLNSGSWVDSCTAITLKDDEFKLVWGRDFDRPIRADPYAFHEQVETYRSAHRGETQAFLSFFRENVFKEEKSRARAMDLGGAVPVLGAE